MPSHLAQPVLPVLPGIAPLSADGVLAFVLLDLTLVLLASRGLGALCTRIGQPSVVGEIVAGLLLGPTVLGHVRWPHAFASWFPHCTAPTLSSCLFPEPAREVIGQLGQIGLLLFSFLTAVELDRATLRRRRRGVLLLGPGVVVAPIALGFALGPLLATPVFRPPGSSTTGFGLFVGVMMAATALPVMARILQQRRLEHSAVGSTGIAASAVATVGLFLALAVSGPATHSDPLSVLRALGVAVGYVALMMFLARPVLAWFTARPGSGRAEEARPDLFAAVLVLLLASGLAAQLAGLTVVVGGFLAGLVLPAAVTVPGTLQRRLDELTRTMLLPVFLVYSGLQTDLTALPVAAAGGLVLLFAGGMLTKWGGGAVLARASGLSWPESNVLGVLMNCPGVVVLVVALVGLREGMITPALQAGVVLVALVSTALTDPLLRLFLPRLPEASLAAPRVLQPDAPIHDHA